MIQGSKGTRVVCDSSAEEVVQEVQAAQATLLGPYAKIIPQVDADTAVLLINNLQKVDLLIEFLRVEANASSSSASNNTVSGLARYRLCRQASMAAMRASSDSASFLKTPSKESACPTTASGLLTAVQAASRKIKYRTRFIVG